MKKLFLGVLFVLAITLHATAQSIIPLTFHLYSGNHTSDAAIADMVCELNANYQSAGVVFYVKQVLHRSSPKSTPSAEVWTYTDKGAMNIFWYLPSGAVTDNYSPTFDAIFISGLSSVVETHELGHAFGLAHADDWPGAPAYNPPLYGPCIFPIPTGDNDQCADTNPNWTTGNWMVGGPYSFASCCFTPCQINDIGICASNRAPNYAANGSGLLSAAALLYDYRNVMPFVQISLESSTYGTVLCVGYPSNSACVNYPTSMDMLVTTQCPDGTNEHQYLITGANPAAAIGLNLTWGISSIVYTFYYPDGHKNSYYVSYSIPGAAGYACTLSPGGNSKMGLTSVNNTTVNDAYILYPNPANTAINISAKTSIDDIEVFNCLGQSEYRHSQPLISNNSLLIDCSHFVVGLHTIRITCSGKTITDKFTIAR